MSYLTRITLIDNPNPARLGEFLTNTYAEHQMLWRLFPPNPDTGRDFLSRYVAWQGRPRYFILSRRRPKNDLGLWDIDEPKIFNPHLSKGQRLVFMLRASPVVTRKNDQGQRCRHDVVMDRKRSIGFRDMSPGERPPLAEIAYSAGQDWIEARGERNCFRIHPEALHINGYQQHRLVKKNGTAPIEFSSLDFEGVLTVTEPGPFTELLHKGIGPAKSFGCGLMLVKPL